MTEETKHTPGPWRVEDPFGDYLSIVVGDETFDWRFVAHVHTDIEKGPAPKPIGKKRMEANAYLIAAAPDMLAALKAWVAMARDALDQYGVDAHPTELARLEQAEAAIAKATPSSH
ncbi:MAG: hypothetical protein KAH44_29035 [Oricola sp.]|nr:hypothetical protein [Oricola sp.]